MLLLQKSCFHKGVSVFVSQAEKLWLITMYIFWCQYICFRLFDNMHMLFIHWKVRQNNNNWTYWANCFAVPCGNSNDSPSHWLSATVWHTHHTFTHGLDVPLRSIRRVWVCSAVLGHSFIISVSVWTLNEWDWIYSSLSANRLVGVS